MSPPVIASAHDKGLDDSRAHGHSELLWKIGPGTLSRRSVSRPILKACPATFISAFSEGDRPASCLHACDLSHYSIRRW
jgi:hypothetical protein